MKHITDVKTVAEFLAKYYKPDRYTGRGKEYAAALLASHEKDFSAQGYDIISRHDNILGEAIFMGTRPGWMEPAPLRYVVGTFRAAGLEAKWTHNLRGTPVICARKPNGDKWFLVNRAMWEEMQSVGVLEGFERSTLLGDLFFIPA